MKTFRHQVNRRAPCDSAPRLWIVIGYGPKPACCSRASASHCVDLGGGL